MNLNAGGQELPCNRNSREPAKLGCNGKSRAQGLGARGSKAHTVTRPANQKPVPATTQTHTRHTFTAQPLQITTFHNKENLEPQITCLRIREKCVQIPWWRGSPAISHDAMTPYNSLPTTCGRRLRSLRLWRQPLLRILPSPKHQAANKHNRVARTDVGVRTRTTTRSANLSSKRKAKNTPKSSRCSGTVASRRSASTARADSPIFAAS